MKVTNRRMKIPSFQCPACDSTLIVDKCIMTDDGEWLIAEQPVVIVERRMNDTLAYLIRATERLREENNRHRKANYERNTRRWWQRRSTE